MYNRYRIEDEDGNLVPVTPNPWGWGDLAWNCLTLVGDLLASLRAFVIANRSDLESNYNYGVDRREFHDMTAREIEAMVNG